MSQTEPQNDPMLKLAFWGTVALTTIAVPLGLLYGAILLSSGRLFAAPGLSGLQPFFFVGVSMLHWSVLARAHDPEAKQYGLHWLACIALSGTFACVTISIANFSMPHGPSAVLFVPTAIGVVSNAVVWRILWQTWSARQKTLTS